MKIEIYTDGSATTIDKPGGWAYVLVVDGQKKAECCGFMANATNNDAEMQAAIEGLAAAYKMIHEVDVFSPEAAEIVPPEVYLVSDSQLILGWASGEYRFKQALKIEKYYQLQALMQKLRVKTRWVRGHNGDEFNERCDKLANEARLGVQNKKDREEAKERGETLIGTKKSGIMCVWYKNSLKVIDLETNVVENYDREIHGPRGTMLEIREEKSR
jgi:ribonuclease HI